MAVDRDGPLFVRATFRPWADPRSLIAPAHAIERPLVGLPGSLASPLHQCVRLRRFRAFPSKGRGHRGSAALPSQPPLSVRHPTVNSSTILRRTEAGEAEVAAAAHGLSLTQRRFLTLLDTSRSMDQLLRHHPAAPEKFERDIARLAQLRLIAVETPVASNEAFEAPFDPVRLGAAPLVRRLPFALVPLVAGALAWLVWHHLGVPAPAVADRAPTNLPPPSAPSPAAAPTADPTPIATRVLKGDARTVVSPVRVVEAKAAGETGGAKPAPALPATRSADATAGTFAAANDAHVASSPKFVAGHEPALIELPAAPVRTPLLAMPILPAVTPPAPPMAPAPTAALVPGQETPATAPPGGTSAPPAAEPGGTNGAPMRTANAAPASRAPPPPLLPVSRVTPDFPREALAIGLTAGDVKARLTVDASGNVVEVEIVEASHRTFDRAVRDALSRWRFEPGANRRTTTVDVAFKRD